MLARRATPQKEAQRILLEYMLDHKLEGTKIPIEDIAEKQCGICVVREDLPDEISAVLSVDEDLQAPTILVNENHHPKRQRFSIAHEVGHYVLHKTKGTHIDNDKKTFFRDADSQKAIYPIEIEANRFAAEMLMPTAMVKRELEKYEGKLLDAEDDDDPIANLADAFQVSSLAMSLKLQNLGYSL